MATGGRVVLSLNRLVGIEKGNQMHYVSRSVAYLC